MTHLDRASGLDRRRMLQVSALGAAGLALGAWNPRLSSAASHAGAGPLQSQPEADPAIALRLAHLTDIHVQPERRAGDGMAACLKHVMALKDRPDLLITGGDLIMDGFEQVQTRTHQLWDLFTRVLKDECGASVEHTLGNHDIWGWNKSKSKCTGQEAKWGKKWALDALGLNRPYRSVLRNGWRIIILDSVAPDPRNENGYIGRLDDDQYAWLAEEVKNATEPTVVVSHIPILSMVSIVFDGNAKEREGKWEVSAGNMHIDGAKIHRLLTANPNIRLCLSGHIHKIDRVELDGLTYICDGAVCGAWWKGPRDCCDEGYGVVDLHRDGTFAHRYERFGWQAEA